MNLEDRRYYFEECKASQEIYEYVRNNWSDYIFFCMNDFKEDCLSEELSSHIYQNKKDEYIDSAITSLFTRSQLKPAILSKTSDINEDDEDEDDEYYRILDFTITGGWLIDFYVLHRDSEAWLKWKRSHQDPKILKAHSNYIKSIDEPTFGNALYSLLSFFSYMLEYEYVSKDEFRSFCMLAPQIDFQLDEVDALSILYPNYFAAGCPSVVPDAIWSLFDPDNPSSSEETRIKAKDARIGARVISALINGEEISLSDALHMALVWRHVYDDKTELFSDRDLGPRSVYSHGGKTLPAYSKNTPSWMDEMRSYVFDAPRIYRKEESDKILYYTHEAGEPVSTSEKLAFPEGTIRIPAFSEEEARSILLNLLETEFPYLEVALPRAIKADKTKLDDFFKGLPLDENKLDKRLLNALKGDIEPRSLLIYLYIKGAKDYGLKLVRLLD